MNLKDTPARRDDGADDQDFLVLSDKGHSSADDGADASGSGLASRVEDQGHGGRWRPCESGLVSTVLRM